VREASELFPIPEGGLITFGGSETMTALVERLQAPSGMGAVQTFSGRHINVSPDGTIEMSADDAQYLIRAGWTKLAEWTRDEAA
jgi:hypothetical protein